MARPCAPRLQCRWLSGSRQLGRRASGTMHHADDRQRDHNHIPSCLTLQRDGMTCIIADQSAGGFTMIPELETADFEAILAPLAGEQPTGVDLRQDYAPNSIYFRLRDARAPARDAERQAETEGGDEGLPTLWRPVATMAIGALKSNSKDLEVATWLTEALVRTAGLRGLMAGASVIAGLVERYWDGLFPMPDEHGMETRVAAVAGLSGQGADGTLMQPLRKSVVSAGRTVRRSVSGSIRQRSNCPASPIRRGAPSGSTRASCLSRKSRRKRAWRALPIGRRNAIRSSRWSLPGRRWSACSTKRRVRTAPRAIGCARCWNSCWKPATDLRRRTHRNRQSTVRAPPRRPHLTASPGAVTGREQALRQLAEVAAWFKRNEPNSPIGFTLDEAVRRARLGWPDLVAELVSDETARQTLLTSVGIKPHHRPQQ